MTEIDIDSEESFMSDGDYSGSTATSVEEEKAHTSTHTLQTLEGVTAQETQTQTQTQTAQPTQNGNSHKRPSSSITSRRSSASINGVPLLGQTKQDVASEVARRIREISQSMDNGPKYVAKPEPRKLSLKKRWRDSFYGGESAPTTPTSPHRSSIVISTPTLKQGSKSSALEISKPISRASSVTTPKRPSSQGNPTRNSFHGDTTLTRNPSVKYGGRRISGPIEVNGTPDFQTVPLAQYNNPSSASLQLSSSHTPMTSGQVETIEMTSQASHFHSMRRKSDGALLNSITNHGQTRSNSMTAASANVTMENPPPAQSMILPQSAGTLHRKASTLSTSTAVPKHRHSPQMSIDESFMEPGLALELERRKVMELKRIATNQNVEKLQLVKQAERERLLFEETEKQLEGQRSEVSRLVQELERVERERKEDKKGHLEVIDSLQRAVHDGRVVTEVRPEKTEEQVITTKIRDHVIADVVPIATPTTPTIPATPDTDVIMATGSPVVEGEKSVSESVTDTVAMNAAIEESMAVAQAAMQRTTVAESQIGHLEGEITHLRLHRDSLRDALTSLRKSSDIEIKSYRDQCMRLEKRLTEMEGKGENAAPAAMKANAGLGLKRLSSSSALGKSSLFIRNELYQELFDRDADVVKQIHESIEEEEEGRKGKGEKEDVHERRGVPRFITVVEEE